MTETKKEDWVLVFDLFTGLHHYAHPDDKRKDYYVTACDISANITGRFVKLEGSSDDGDESAELTCEDYFLLNDAGLLNRDQWTKTPDK